jgi:Targeting protein for Xklp2 (TPX2) domain
VEKYRAQFEARLAHWEVRTREAAQNNEHQSIPDFAARQAEHLARIEAARQAAKAKVTEPKTPGLKTKIRVKERQVFDEHIREKERIVFKLREMKRIEQDELERREIGELRKKLDQNVKANPVPEWCRADNGNDEIQIVE